MRDPDIITGKTPMQFWVMPEKDVPKGMCYAKIACTNRCGLVLAFSPVKEGNNEKSYIAEQVRSAPLID